MRGVAVQVELGADGVTCANVGDSRALLLSKQQEEWTFQPLSSDHNVQNLSESRRLAAAGVQPGAFTVITIRILIVLDVGVVLVQIDMGESGTEIGPWAGTSLNHLETQ